jgi:SAM-dependent methyltransferase
MSERVDRTPDAAEWDERYSGSEQVWSGNPNGALVAEVADLPPGRALDVGCGEGADAVWLARRGWQVTALDVSRVALERAERHAAEAGVEVTWVLAGLVEAELPPGSFDLVSAQYAVLRKTPRSVAERTLIGLVAPGGTLLVVHHVLEDFAADHSGQDHSAHGHQQGGFDPAEYALPDDIAAHLGDGWRIEVREQRPRVVTSGAGAGHVEDVVLRARRT